MKEANDKFSSEKNQLENIINVCKLKIEDLNNKLKNIIQEYDDLKLQDQSKAREIEALKLKINAIQDREKENGVWKQRSQDLQKSHTQTLEEFKIQADTSLKSKLVLNNQN